MDYRFDGSVTIRILTTTINIVKVGIATGLTVFINTGLLFGTIKTIDATQTEIPLSSEQRTVPDCIFDGQKPEPGLICTNPNIPCPLETAKKKDYANAIGGKQ